MFSLKTIGIIYGFFTKKTLRSKKTKFFILFSLTPILVYLLIALIKIIGRGDPVSGEFFYKSIGMPFFFQLYIPLIALLSGAAVLGDEIENKTLIYLNTSPVEKASTLLGKFASHMTVSYISFLAGSLVLYVLTHLTGIILFENLSAFFQLQITGLLAIIAYGSFFLLLGVSMKKSTIIGLVFIFGWESIAQILPGAAQKMTIFFYVNAVAPFPVNIPREHDIMIFTVTKPGFIEGAVTLLVLSVICFLVSLYVFRRREYLLADHS